MSVSSSRATGAHNRITASSAALRRTEVLLLLGVLIVALLLRLPGLRLPLERDEGAYAYVAWNWLHGGLPYRDAFDHKPPLIYLLYMPMLLFGTPTALALRVWATFLFLLSVTLVYLIGRHAWQWRTALLAALIFSFAGSAFDLQGLILNTDQALILPALLVLWCAIRLHETQQSRFAVGAGAALTATILIKPVAVVLIPAMLVACRRQVRSMVQVYSGVALGAALVSLPIMAYFALRGGWNDLVFGVLTYNRLYALESHSRWELGGLINMFTPFVPLLLVALGGVVLVLQQDSPQVVQRRAVWLVAAWCAALFVAAVGSLRAFVHYYYPLLPFLALLAAPCVEWLRPASPAASLTQRIAQQLSPLLLLGFVIVPFGLQNARLIGTTSEQQAERLYDDVGKHYFNQAPFVAEYIREHTQPDDYIYVFAAEPEVYVLAERRASSRYIYDYPLGLVPGAAAELGRDLAAKPPRLVITYFGVRPDGFIQTMRAQNFVKLTEIGRYEVFGPE